MCETLRQKILMDVLYLAELLVWEDTTPEVGWGTIWRSRIVSGKFCSKQEAIAATLHELDKPIVEDAKLSSDVQTTEQSETGSSKPKSVWSRDYVEDRRCPKCGEMIVLLTNRNNGKWFYGCATYPKCRWSWSPSTYSHNTYTSRHRVDIDEWGDIDEIAENFPCINGSELGVDWMGVMP